MNDASRAAGASPPSTVPPALKPIAQAILQQALEWQVTFWSGEVTAEERADFQCWLAADSEHARAWAQVQRTDEKLQILCRPVAAEALRTGAAAARNARRTMLGVAGLLAGAGVAVYAVRQTPQWQFAGADHRTGRNERREIALADGARLMLGSATAVDVRYDAGLRLVLLHAGEIFIVTALDHAASSAGAARPFVVQTAEGSMRALGTRFGVRRSDGATRVAVQEGAVEIRPVQEGTAGIVQVHAGQQAHFNRAFVEPLQPLEPNAIAWTRGLLVAERMRLEDFLAELGRYRSGVLRCDPAVRDLIVSGVYSLDDTDRALRNLAKALPVQVQTATRWWVTVKPRPAGTGTEPSR